MSGITSLKTLFLNSVGEDGKLFTHKLFEYQWPPDKNGEWFVLQEQISQFLNIKSFKRKYPSKLYEELIKHIHKLQ